MKGNAGRDTAPKGGDLKEVIVEALPQKGDMKVEKEYAEQCYLHLEKVSFRSAIDMDDTLTNTFRFTLINFLARLLDLYGLS